MMTLRKRRVRRLLACLAAVGLGLLLLHLPWSPAQPPAKAAADTNLPAEWVKSMAWRSIGPANMGGRITALAVYEADPTIYYVATASGGLLKTTNNGVTFQHQFDRERTVSIGDVCVSQANPNIVWVGTGEANPRNSVSYGDGVYKSLDGGRTWKNMGLNKTFQIGRIAIHPKNPDIVYVGALGRLYGPNPERGLFKTTDGGKTWKKVLYTDDNTGVIDVKMHPTEPDTLLVAMWERKRDGFDSYIGEPLPDGLDGYDPVTRWGKSSGIYKTTDGGKTFQRMTRGLPTNSMGRIGLDYYRKDPRVVFAVVDCQKIGMGTPPKVVAAPGYLGIQGEDGDPGPGARITVVTPNGPADEAGLQVGDLIQGIGTVKIVDYGDLLDEIEKHVPGDKVKFAIRRDQQARAVEVTFGKRPGKFVGKGGPGGQKKGRPYYAYLGGQKENVQDQQGVDSFEYGGIYKSTDGGESWARINSLNSRPMYFGEIRVDPTDERYLYHLGVALHRSSNGGRTFRPDGASGPRGAHA
ncbi:MAG TPA: PDZ domain-containing protein, partial [Gemmataceae bacterium]|nr:PDZ domain-containing protein [Gemmataceae bacterium]